MYFIWYRLSYFNNIKTKTFSIEQKLSMKKKINRIYWNLGCHLF